MSSSTPSVAAVSSPIANQLSERACSSTNAVPAANVSAGKVRSI
ncbi:MAG: hypothetical protein AAF633_00640 [Chloroflexota bacterium]